MENSNFNILLDEKPVAWQGFPINSDFRTGIQICMICEDTELSQNEQMLQACDLLFTGICPEFGDMQKAVIWFLEAWNLDKKSKVKDKLRVMDFDVDQWRIYSAFLHQYGINLNTADLHYWEFMGLLTTLEECAFTRVIDIRRKKITPKMRNEEKQAIKDAQSIYSLEQPKQESYDEKVKNQAAIEVFEKMRKGANT